MLHYCPAPVFRLPAVSLRAKAVEAVEVVNRVQLALIQIIKKNRQRVAKYQLRTVKKIPKLILEK